MKIIIVLVISFLVLISNTVLAEDKVSAGEPGGGGIVYGSEIGISVSAPDGWTFDAKSGVPQGLHGVMYPDGSSWSKSSEIMYVNMGKMQEGETLDKFIEADIDSFLINSPNLKIEKLTPIQISGKEKAETRLFIGDKWGNYEQIAYAQHKGSVAIYVLSCKTKEGYQKSQAAFQEMVAKSFIINIVLEKRAN